MMILPIEQENCKKKNNIHIIRMSSMPVSILKTINMFTFCEVCHKKRFGTSFREIIDSFNSREHHRKHIHTPQLIIIDMMTHCRSNGIIYLSVGLVKKKPFA